LKLFSPPLAVLVWLLSFPAKNDLLVPPPPETTSAIEVTSEKASPAHTALGITRKFSAHRHADAYA